MAGKGGVVFGFWFLGPLCFLFGAGVGVGVGVGTLGWAVNCGVDLRISPKSSYHPGFARTAPFVSIFCFLSFLSGLFFLFGEGMGIGIGIGAGALVNERFTFRLLGQLWDSFLTRRVFVTFVSFDTILTKMGGRWCDIGA